MTEGSTRDRGRAVETQVATFLGERGLRVLDANVERCGAEIDLIAVDPRYGEPEYVFVEVRSRASAERGTPQETVNAAKQRRIVRAATAWLVERDLWEQVAVRFDVVGAVVSGVETAPLFDWIENAFEA